MSTAPRHSTLVLPEPGLAQVPWLADVQPGLIICPEADATAARNLCPKMETFGNGCLHPARDDLDHIAMLLGTQGGTDGPEVLLGRDLDRPWGYEAFYTTLGLAGMEHCTEVSQRGARVILLPRRPISRPRRLLLKACGGIGNLIQASCVAGSALRHGIETLFCPLGDTTGRPMPELFAGHGLEGLVVVGPGERDGADLILNIEARSLLEPGDLFHSPYRVGADLSESRLYARFFENVTGLTGDAGAVLSGGRNLEPPRGLAGRIVICPGSKPGWDSKRWPHMAALVRALPGPVILCKPADLEAYSRMEHLEPMEDAGAHGAAVALDLSLPQAAAVLRHARAVVANDCGMAHLAAATGAPTLILFGPSQLIKNRPPGTNVHTLAQDMECRPCQGADPSVWPGTLGPHGYSCRRGFACLKELSVDTVLAALEEMLGNSPCRRNRQT